MGPSEWPARGACGNEGVPRILLRVKAGSFGILSDGPRSACVEEGLMARRCSQLYLYRALTTHFHFNIFFFFLAVAFHFI